ncbi:conserved hypothetical protein [Histoplasma capsulatum H143]|uniref:Uncharacterized protein n=1 Tax=Ajellomyces capsulatus (strain H143) TaxID=544712 RepID=C6HHP8_AJECH|nr:conserved hypothetical protein [Histoplasma capsulatum H143]
MGPTILIPLSPFPQMQPGRIIPLKIQRTAANALRDIIHSSPFRLMQATFLPPSEINPRINIRLSPEKSNQKGLNPKIRKMTSAALASINRRIKKHLQRKVDLYVERSEVLRERRAADMAAVAEKRKREDEAFKAEVGRANVKQREEQIWLAGRLTKGEMSLMADQASTTARA